MNHLMLMGLGPVDRIQYIKAAAFKARRFDPLAEQAVQIMHCEEKWAAQLINSLSNPIHFSKCQIILYL